MSAYIAPVHTPTVWLVGAGPGDPELLTLKALRIIRAATVLLVDDLVSEALIEHALDGLVARPRLVHVGKRGGCASTPQAFIEKLMLREALAGERVVRLKGGDPYVFGRGGEEASSLRAAGVQVEVVAGITAGLAAAGAIGAPWTDRRHAQGVMLVTGHAQPGAPGPDWAAIGAAAASGLTLVIYMGVAQAASLQAQLLPALGADMPAAVVERASLPGERVVLTTLGDLVDTIAREGLQSPAVLWVGRVLCEAPAWAQGTGLSRKARSAANERSGASSCGRWPTSGSDVNVAFGSAAR